MNNKTETAITICVIAAYELGYRTGYKAGHTMGKIAQATETMRIIKDREDNYIPPKRKGLFG